MPGYAVVFPVMLASMKALPKRKGNTRSSIVRVDRDRLNESPSEKEGKSHQCEFGRAADLASMKALPKRKGNADSRERAVLVRVLQTGLNESPSEKEGKYFK